MPYVYDAFFTAFEGSFGCCHLLPVLAMIYAPTGCYAALLSRSFELLRTAFPAFQHQNWPTSLAFGLSGRSHKVVPLPRPLGGP